MELSQAPIWPVATDAFIADTTRLSAEETGAYMMLLMCLWRNNGVPLDFDEKQFSRMARVSPRRWPKIWASIESFFEINDGCVTQKRLRKDWVKVQEKILTNRVNASRGGKAKALKNKEKPLANATISAEPKGPVGLPNHEPEPLTNKKRTIKKSFLPFWEMWPRKIGRLHAEGAWETATKLAESEEIMAGLKLQIEAWKAEGREAKFIPYPATWLNRGNWINDFGLTLTTPEQDTKTKAWNRGEWTNDDWREFLGKPGSAAFKRRMNDWICYRRDGSGYVPVGDLPGEPGCLVPREILTEYGLAPGGISKTTLSI